MDESLGSNCIQLSLPAEKTMMLVVRLTTAGVIARSGLTLDRIDDVKLAIEEACNCIMTQECAPKRLALTFSCTDKQLSATIRWDDDISCEGSVDEDELEVIRAIFESLAGHVEIGLTGGWVSSIRMDIKL